MKQKVLVYAPQVRVVVLGSDGQEYDLSRDVVGGSVNRMRDSVSTASVTLDNRAGKYYGKIERMDRIVISLKKDKWTQVFAGYVTQVPVFDIEPTTVDIEAECTLKRLMHTWWDPGLPDSQEILQTPENVSDDSTSKDSADAGSAKMLTDLLVKVGGWKLDDIFVSKIPDAFLQTAMKYQDISTSDPAEFEALKAAIMPSGINGGDGTVGGEGASSINGESISGGGGPPGLEAFLWAIRERESSGRYALHDNPSYTGAFQFGVEEWANYGGYPVPWKAPPSVQNKKATEWFTNFWNKYHDWKKCAAAHFGGPGVANHPEKWGRSDGGMNIRQYVHDVVDVKMPKYQAQLGASGGSTTGTDSSSAASAGASAVASAAAGTKRTTNNPVDSIMKGESGGVSVTALPGQISIDKVIAQAKTALGRPYNMSSASGGAHGSSNGCYDCSGLTSMAYGLAAGIDIGRDARQQYRNLSDAKVSASTIAPGDLIFYYYGRVGPVDHVAMYIGGGQMIEASHKQGKTVIGSARLSDHVVAICRPSLSAISKNKISNFGGSAITGVDSGTGADGVTDGVKSLFAWEALMSGTSRGTALSGLLVGEKSLINDVPLINSISAISKASMRTFMSSPTGEFYATFPDYFGLWGTKPSLFVEDVELIDLKVTLKDAPLTTHVFAFGDVMEDGGSFGAQDSDIIGGGSWVNVFQSYVFKELINSSYKLGTPSEFVRRFGVRPLQVDNPVIRSRTMEYMLALYTFMDQWSKQFNTNVSIGFMPEAWPGMRMTVTSLGVTVFIESVTHSFDYTSGFNTNISISSPTAEKNSPLGDTMLSTF